MTEQPDAGTPLEPDFDPDSGLVPAVVQDVRSGRIRMLGYMSRESLERTRRTGRVTFYSRSRQELWEKGETSGNWLEARSIELDCDGDALLVRAVPHGPTCHTGRESCFDGPTMWEAPAGGDRPDEEAGPEAGRRAREAGTAPGRRDGPEAETGEDRLAAVLAELRRVVARREQERPEGSYTVRLLAGGPRAAGRKVAEEALEVALDAAGGGRRLDEESADLLYHLLVLWRSTGVEADQVARVLERRRADPDAAGSSSAGGG